MSFDWEKVDEGLVSTHFLAMFYCRDLNFLIVLCSCDVFLGTTTKVWKWKIPQPMIWRAGLLIVPILQPGLSHTGGDQWIRPQPHTPPVNANLVSVMGGCAYFLFHSPLLFHLLHIIKYYSHSFVPLLSHTSTQYLSYLLVVFSPCCTAAAENRNNRGGRWLKERLEQRVTRAEVTLIYSLLPQLQLEVKG